MNWTPPHFLIPIAVDGQPKVVDGWLQNDDTIKLHMTDGTSASLQ